MSEAPRAKQTQIKGSASLGTSLRSMLVVLLLIVTKFCEKFELKMWGYSTLGILNSQKSKQQSKLCGHSISRITKQVNCVATVSQESQRNVTVFKSFKYYCKIRSVWIIRVGLRKKEKFCTKIRSGTYEIKGTGPLGSRSDPLCGKC